MLVSFCKEKALFLNWKQYLVLQCLFQSTIPSGGGFCPLWRTGSMKLLVNWAELIIYAHTSSMLTYRECQVHYFTAQHGITVISDTMIKHPGAILTQFLCNQIPTFQKKWNGQTIFLANQVYHMQGTGLNWIIYSSRCMKSLPHTKSKGSGNFFLCAKW